MKFILLVSLPLYALDQWTKQLVTRFIDPDQPRILIAGFFNLVNVTNTGAAFGSFRNNNSFFIAISIIALVVVVTLLARPRVRNIWRDVSLALLLAGLLGNLPDRLIYWHVFDFHLFDVQVHYAHPWLVFHLADH